MPKSTNNNYNINDDLNNNSSIVVEKNQLNFLLDQLDKLKNGFDSKLNRLNNANTIGTIDAISGNFLSDMQEIERKNSESNDTLHDSFNYFY